MASVRSSSTYRSERSSTCFEPRGRCGEEGERGSPRHGPYGYTGSPPGPGPPCSRGGSVYQVTADVSQFAPQDVVVTTSNYHVAIQAETVAADGTVSNSFTRRCQLPEDTDPLSLSCARTAAGLLVVTARRQAPAPGGEPPPPLYRTEVKL